LPRSAFSQRFDRATELDNDGSQRETAIANFRLSPEVNGNSSLLLICCSNSVAPSARMKTFGLTDKGTYFHVTRGFPPFWHYSLGFDAKGIPEAGKGLKLPSKL